MLRKISLVLFMLIVNLALGSCSILFSEQDDGLESTRIALAVQQTQFAIEQSQPKEGQPSPQEQPTEEPTQETQPPEEQPTEEETQETQSTEEETQETQPTEEETQETQPTEEETSEDQPQEDLFSNVEAEPKAFFCNPADGLTELTIAVDMTDINRGGALFWRLHEKAMDRKLDWELVDMGRDDWDTRIYTFDADIAAGTDNFSYPSGMDESWFEFQIISNDGAARTEVFADVTFFPCP